MKHTPAPRKMPPRVKRRGLFSLRALVLYVLFVALVSTVSLSKYSTTVTGTGTMTVARPAISLTRTEIKLNGTLVGESDSRLQNLVPDDVITCKYTVSNQETINGSTVTSEVKMRYKLIAPNIPPLVFIIDGTPGEMGWVALPHSIPQSYEHTLTATLPEEFSNAAAGVTGQQIALTVTLQAEQMDN